MPDRSLQARYPQLLWIVDYNRQSLDATTADRMFRPVDDIFETCGWRVMTLKYGKRQQAAFARPGGHALQDWIDTCPNADFAALTYQGGPAWRERIASRTWPATHGRSHWSTTSTMRHSRT